MIRALSLSRPWTELVLRHGKDIENRRWGTHYRGPLVVHGAKSWDRSAAAFAAELLGANIVTAIPPVGETPTGYLGVVDLVEVCDREQYTGGCACGPWAMAGQYHWRLENPRPFPEVQPGSGQLGLWQPPERVLELVAL